MSTDFPQIPVSATNAFEAVTAATASSTKGLQAIATEMTDYSKKSFEKEPRTFRKAGWREERQRSDPAPVGLRQIRLRGFRRGSHQDRQPLFRSGQGSFHADEKIGCGPSS